MTNLSIDEEKCLDAMLDRRPNLDTCAESLIRLHGALVETFENDGKLVVCGNGGSMADAMHIAGELEKSFERGRPVPPKHAVKLEPMPFGTDLVGALDVGLPVLVLGLNHSLKTAVENDSHLRDAAFAQETYVNIRAGDLFLGISTSGKADNCVMAMSVAKAMNAVTASLTGPDGGPMATLADIAVKSPGPSVHEIQETHVVLYHTLCAMIEIHFFPTRKNDG